MPRSTNFNPINVASKYVKSKLSNSSKHKTGTHANRSVKQTDTTEPTVPSKSNLLERVTTKTKNILTRTTKRSASRNIERETEKSARKIKRPTWLSKKNKSEIPTNIGKGIDKTTVKAEERTGYVTVKASTTGLLGKYRSYSLSSDNSGIEKNINSQQVAEGAANIPAPIILNAVDIQLSQQEAIREVLEPPLGATIVDEKAAFLHSLEEATKGLEGDEKYKAVLTHIQSRYEVTDLSNGEDETSVKFFTGNYGFVAINDEGKWTYVADNTNQDVQQLGEGDTITDTITIQSVDGTTKDITVAIKGTNDVAVISGTSEQTIAEDSADTLTAEGALTVTDIDQGEAKFVAETVQGNYGSIDINEEGNWIYTADNSQEEIQKLASGNTLNDVVSVKSVDGTTQDITITITGTNDQAVISGSSAQTLTEDNAETLIAKGTLTVADADYGESKFVAGSVEGTYGSMSIDESGAWTYTVDNSQDAIQQLNAGDNVTEIVTVKTIDGTTQNITVMIQGTNDAAVISGTSAQTIAEDAADTLVAKGALTIADVDAGEDKFVAGIGEGIYGSLAINEDGSWSYTADNTQVAIQQLGDGQFLKETFAVQSADGATKNLSITIKGTNDAAVIAGTSEQTIAEDSAETLVAEGALTITDADAGEAQFVAGTGEGVFGSLTINEDGTWNYAADNTQEAIQKLGEGDTAKDIFNVRSIDGTTQNIVINITGKNDGAVISGTSDATVTEDGSHILTAGGTLTIEDADQGEGRFVTEILETKGQDMTSGDHAQIGKLWVDTSIEEGHLPKGSTSAIIQIKSTESPENTHEVVEVKTPEGGNYIIDGSQYDNDPAADPTNLIPESAGNASIDQSIADKDLQEHMYGPQDTAPDPSSLSPGDYADRLAAYGSDEFWEDSFTAMTENTTGMAISAGSAVAEGALATAFSAYKYHKIAKRRQNITDANRVQIKDSQNNYQDGDKQMTFSNFKDFAKISHFVDNNNLAKILDKDVDFISLDDAKDLIDNLNDVFPNDNKSLDDLKEQLTEDNFKNPQFINGKLTPTLKKYGINIKYETMGTLTDKAKDKFRSQKDKKLDLHMHKIVIDKKNFYKQLKEADKIPTVKIISTTVRDSKTDIETLNKLQNYDDRKLKFNKQDAGLKFGAAIAGMVPFIPIDEATRAGAYTREKNYRLQNEKNMEFRYNASKKILQNYQADFSEDNYDKIKTALDNIKEVKTKHMHIKETKAEAMRGIHVAAGVAKPLTDVAGPVGSGVRGGIKGAAKIGTAVAAGVVRHKGDKALQQEGKYTTTKELYSLYKQVYLEAANDSNAKKAIQNLVAASFDIDSKEFELLVKSSLVESNLFKLSLSRPTESKARVSLPDSNRGVASEQESSYYTQNSTTYDSTTFDSVDDDDDTSTSV
jgi:VCBS repeat-containing protein